jgi:hypothetical protein
VPRGLRDWPGPGPALPRGTNVGWSSELSLGRRSTGRGRRSVRGRPNGNHVRLRGRCPAAGFACNLDGSLANTAQRGWARQVQPATSVPLLRFGAYLARTGVFFNGQLDDVTALSVSSALTAAKKCAARWTRRSSPRQRSRSARPTGVFKRSGDGPPMDTSPNGRHAPPPPPPQRRLHNHADAHPQIHRADLIPAPPLWTGLQCRTAG